MKRKYILGILLILTLGMIILPKPAIAYETTEYLPFGESVYYGVEMEIGDNLTWSFETWYEEFEVWLMINDEDISIGEISDSGIWIAPSTDTFYIIFINYDILLFRDGFIDIYFEVNVEPDLPSPFTLTSNADNPDTDGVFLLSWTISEYANNYSVYQNDALLDSGLTELYYSIKIYSNGSYSFKVIAFNNYGNIESNEITVNVQIPIEPEPADKKEIIGFNMIPLISVISIITVISLALLKIKQKE